MVFYKRVLLLGILLIFYGCAKVNPYDGFKAYYFGDYQKAFEIYSQACEEGDEFMCHSIAGMFEKGLAVAQDFKKAFKYYLTACQQGLGQSCYSVGKMYREGKIIRYDPIKATEYYLKACEQSVAEACYSSGVMYYNKQDDPESKPLIKALFGKACDLGDQKGCDIYRKLDSAGY